jgi:hypothetical protein
LNQLIAVVKVNGDGHVVNDFVGLVKGNLETIRDGGRVDTLGEQLLGGAQKGSSNNDNRGSSISSFNILGF